MMNCRQVQNVMFENTDGLLSPRAQAAVKRHLDQCEDCRKAAKELQRSSQLLGDRFRNDTKSLALPAEMRGRIVGSVGGTPTDATETVALPGLVWRLLAGAAVILTSVLVCMKLGVGRQSDGKAPARLRDSATTVSIRISYCEPTHIFRANDSSVIDSFTCQPQIVEESLQLPGGQIDSQQERNSRL
jgi:anti-sigma factor RsiW